MLARGFWRYPFHHFRVLKMFFVTLQKLMGRPWYWICYLLSHRTWRNQTKIFLEVSSLQASTHKVGMWCTHQWRRKWITNLIQLWLLQATTWQGMSTGTIATALLLNKPVTVWLNSCHMIYISWSPYLTLLSTTKNVYIIFCAGCLFLFLLDPSYSHLGRENVSWETASIILTSNKAWRAFFG